jgi:hypothetical protein
MFKEECNMKYIVSRLAEPSTYAGFAAFAVALGISDVIYTAASAALAGVFGLIAVLAKD